MNDYTKDMVSDVDRAAMDKADYAEIMKRARNYGYDPKSDMAYNGEEKWCK